MCKYNIARETCKNYIARVEMCKYNIAREEKKLKEGLTAKPIQSSVLTNFYIRVNEICKCIARARIIIRVKIHTSGKKSITFCKGELAPNI